MDHNTLMFQVSELLMNDYEWSIEQLERIPMSTIMMACIKSKNGLGVSEIAEWINESSN